MFRLIKLAAFVLLGYALYEFFQGLVSDAEMAAQGGSRGRGTGGGGSIDPGLHGRSGNVGQRVTGPGEGMPVETENPDGGGARHIVGRGVIPS